VHAAPAMKLMMPLLVATAVASCAGSDDGATGPGPDLILGEDEEKEDAAPGVEVAGFLDPARAVDGAFTTSVPRLGYVFYAKAGTSVGVEITRAGSATGLDTELRLHGPRDAFGRYPAQLAEDDDAGYGKLSKVDDLTIPADGFYLAELAPKTAPTARKPVRLALTCDGGSCERPAAPIGNDLRWAARSAEYRAQSIQAYALATARLQARAATGLPAAWGVVLDIDETTLSNLTYQQERGELGVAYSTTSWQAWVARKAATPMPGAKAFLDRVRALGGKVVLVSNRKQDGECPATADNLAAVGIRPDAMLCRTSTSDKNPRFSAVAAGTAGLPPLEVVLFVGDNIQDFPALSQDVRDDGDDALAGFTDRFVLLANPMYGSWEKNL
jgi:5'-nucleotidase (lipoprotein e(P4) family)